MAINYLSSINLNDNEIQNAKLHPLASIPSVGAEGTVYFNTTTDTLYISNGSTWLSVSGDIEDVLAGTGIACPYSGNRYTHYGYRALFSWYSEL